MMRFRVLQVVRGQRMKCGIIRETWLIMMDEGVCFLEKSAECGPRAFCAFLRN